MAKYIGNWYDNDNNDDDNDVWLSWILVEWNSRLYFNSIFL